MMTHEAYCRVREALDKLIRLQAQPEVIANTYLQCAVYSVEVSLTAALDAERRETCLPAN